MYCNPYTRLKVKFQPNRRSHDKYEIQHGVQKNIAFKTVKALDTRVIFARHCKIYEYVIIGNRFHFEPTKRDQGLLRVSGERRLLSDRSGTNNRWARSLIAVGFVPNVRSRTPIDVTRTITTARPEDRVMFHNNFTRRNGGRRHFFCFVIKKRENT